ncbi:hypothetical protein CBP31_00340 [Oceanisphaera profunda]|uniref:Uncharacterized protein n=1 Tax=Oceanisphaera profunda TaxID=1416627 RepID=A0A1Y0D171_9GAMM|nr:hypothetical protein [Oceanisphaera profunda]ART81269.1 hypothetical protein CBP31_00340 [Oceanisphaera profunda]
MKKLKRIGLMAAIALVAVLGIEMGAQLSIPGMSSVISSAEARVGRPLTPVSVAGVARRTVRRCAVGVYNC